MRAKILSRILIFFSLLSVFIPMSIVYLPGFYFLVPVLRILRFAILGWLLLRLIAKHSIRPRLIILVVFLLLILLGTVLNSGTLVNWIDNASSILLVATLVELYYFNPSSGTREDFIKNVFFFFFILCFANLIGMFFYPNGAYRVVYEKSMWHELSYPVFFLQTSNRLISFVLPLCAFTIMAYRKKLIGFIVMVISIAVVIITVYLTKSETTYSGIIVFFISVFLTWRKEISIKTAKIVTFVLFVLQISFEIIMTQPIILAAVSYLFGSTDTFISRFQLGSEAQYYFLNKPVFGYGTGDSGRYFVEGSMTYWVHNHSWDLLVQGGLVGYFAYFLYLFPMRIKKADASILTELSGIVFAAMVSLLVMGNAESFLTAMEFYLFAAMFDLKRV